MAGAGYKLFNTGDVLTAAQVNTYLQEQVVMVFANATARTTGLSGVLAEGMVSYLQDTNAVEVYNGSAWVSVANAGDITAVNVTSPITGGGSSGDVTIGIQDGTTAQKGAVQLEDSTSSTSTTKAATPNSVKSAYDLANAAIAKSLIDAEGDLIVGDAADQVQRLAIGTNGQVLTVDTSVDGKIKWAAAAGGGKVVQIVSATYSTEVSNSTSTLADTGLTATITPSSASNKILVFATIAGIHKSEGNANNQLHLALLRGSTVISSALGLYTETAIKLSIPYNTITKEDSPNTTSATTYKVQFANYNNTAAVKVQNVSSFLTATSNIILMEVTP